MRQPSVRIIKRSHHILHAFYLYSHIIDIAELRIIIDEKISRAQEFISIRRCYLMHNIITISIYKPNI